MLALGDTAYVEFCAIGKALDERFAALGGKRVVDRVDCDLDFAAPAADWIGRAVKALAPADGGRGTVIEVDFGKSGAAPKVEIKTEIVEAEIIEHVNLNSSQSGKETFHLALSFDGAAPAYEPGDSLDVYPENDPAEVDELLKAAGLAADQALRNDFIKSQDIHTLSLKSLETYATLTGHQYVKALIADGQRARMDRRAAAHRPRHPVPDRDHRRAAPCRDKAAGAARLLDRLVAARVRRRGASSGLRRALREPWPRAQGRRLQLRRRAEEARRARPGEAPPQPAFCAACAGRDIIMVGPGTGIAPFRAFVQERRATAAKGRNWLFFGDRQFTHDFLYQLEWQEALKDGSLNRMDVAFSRDQPQKIYVQDRLWERRRDLVEWLDGGASFYVCGDAKAMAKDVRAALVRAYADVKSLPPEAAEQAVAALERDKRYPATSS